MSDKDYIKDLFSDKLGNYEAKVNPELWNGIASQIGAAGTTAATGMSIVTKWIIGVSIASVVTVSAVVILNGGEEETPVNEDRVAQTEVVSPEVDAEDNATGSEVVSSPDIEEQPEIQEITNSGTDSEIGSEPASVNPVIPAVDPNSVIPEATNNPTPAYTPSADPNPPVTENKDPKVKQEVPVHTPDPIVYEPSFPAEIEAEENTSQEANFSIGKLPNVFTPNDDGENDYFRIESENLTEFSITILNSENAIVYQSADPNFIWDGRNLAGEPVADGNYVYFITAREFSGDKPKRFSPLLIKRTR